MRGKALGAATRRGPGVLLVLVLAAAPAARGEERLLVSNQSAGTVQLVDPAALRILATRTVARQPLTVAVSPDRRFALVAGVGYVAGGGGLTVLDLTQPSLPVVATVSRKSRVYGVDVLPDGRTAVAARVNPQGFAELQLVDLTTSPPRDLGKPVPLGGARSAYAVAVTPDGTRAYVQDYSGSRFFIVDLTRAPPVVVTSVGTNRAGIFLRLAPDGQRLLTVSIWRPPLAGVWDVTGTSPKKLANLTVGTNPGAIPAFEPASAFALVAAAGSGDLWVLDTHAAAPTVIGRLANVGSDLRGVTATCDGTAAWASSRSRNLLVEVDLRNPASPRLTGRTLRVNGGPNHLLAFGELHHRGVPALGTVLPLFVASPPDAGRAYLLGASFGTRPGIAVGPHRIPLNLDNLFLLSQSVPALFQGFQGVLNSSGQAVASLRIPAAPALRGLSLYAAGVILDPQSPFGIRRVTNATHLVLR